MKDLGDFKSNKHSQNGEDGIIAEIINRLGLVVNKDFYSVEFGAWDGIHLSNTFALVEQHGASAVYIEGDSDKVPSLTQDCYKAPINNSSRELSDRNANETRARNAGRGACN